MSGAMNIIGCSACLSASSRPISADVISVIRDDDGSEFLRAVTAEGGGRRWGAGGVEFDAWRYHPEMGYVPTLDRATAELHARFFKKVFKKATSFASSAYNNVIKPLAVDAWNWAKDAAKDAVNWAKNIDPRDIGNWLENAGKDALNWMDKVRQDPLGTFGDALDHARNLGEILLDGAKDLGETLVDLGKGLADNFVDWAEGMVECAKKLDPECMLKETLLAIVRGGHRIADSGMRMIEGMGNTFVRLGKAVLDIIGDIMRAINRLINRLLEELNIITLPEIDCPGEQHILPSGRASFRGATSVPHMERMNKFRCPLQWYTKNTIKYAFIPNRLTTVQDMRPGDVLQIEAEARPPEVISQYPYLRRNIVTVIPDPAMISGMGIVGNMVLGKTLGINIESLLSVCYMPEIDRYCTDKPFRTGLYFTPGVRRVLFRKGQSPDLAFARNAGCSGYAGCQCEPTCSICPVMMTEGADEVEPTANLLMVQNPDHPENMDSSYVGKDRPQDFADLRTRLQSNVVAEFINGGNSLSTTQDMLYRASCLYPADAWRGDGKEAEKMARHVQSMATQGTIPEHVFEGMMRVHCQQATSDPTLCPPDALGTMPGTCMRIMAEPLCKEWWSGDMKRANGTPLVNELDRDQMRQTLCARYPHAPECDCLRSDVLEFKAVNPYDAKEKAQPCPPCGAVDDASMPPRCRVRCMAYRRTLKGAHRGGRPLACSYPACMAAGRTGNFQTAYTVATQENCATICTNVLNVLGSNISRSFGSVMMSVDSCGNSTAAPLNPLIVDAASGKFDHVLHTVGYVAGACFIAAVASFALARRARPSYGARE